MNHGNEAYSQYLYARKLARKRVFHDRLNKQDPYLEVLDDLTREGNDGSLPLLLGYYSLRALEKGTLPRPLVKAVFELRLIVQEGVFRGLSDDMQCHPAMRRAVSFIEHEPLSKIYSFTLDEEPLRELIRFADAERNRFFQHPFSSLTILEALQK